MNFPPEVYEIASRHAQANLNNIEAAVAQAEAEIRALDDFDSLLAAMVTNAVQELVYAARHQHKLATKNAVGGFHTRPKVAATSAETNVVYRSVYDLCIAGRTLGSLKGSDLPAIASSERNIAGGHLFNAELAEELIDRVQGDHTVREKVAERTLKAIVKRLMKKYPSASSGTGQSKRQEHAVA